MSRPLFVKTLNGWVEGESVWQKTKNGWVKGEAMAVKTNSGWQSATQAHTHSFEYNIYSIDSDTHAYGAFCKDYETCGGVNWSTQANHTKDYIYRNSTYHQTICTTTYEGHQCNFNTPEEHDIYSFSGIAPDCGNAGIWPGTACRLCKATISGGGYRAPTGKHQTSTFTNTTATTHHIYERCSICGDSKTLQQGSHEWTVGGPDGHTRYCSICGYGL